MEVELVQCVFHGISASKLISLTAIQHYNHLNEIEMRSFLELLKFPYIKLGLG